MLSILLLILKIIGLLLLFIIMFVLSLFLIVLLVPIRYKFKVLYNNNQNQSSFTLHWLLHFIHVNVSYKDDLNLSIRILGISFDTFKKLLDFVKKLKPNQKVATHSKDEKNTDHKSETDIEKTTECEIKDNATENDSIDEKISESKNISIDEKISESKNNNIDQKTSKFKDDSNNTDDNINKPGFVEKITNLFEKYSEKYYNVRRLLELNEKDKKSISYIKKNVILIIKHILPRRIKGKLYFGFSDPSKTGYTLGIISIFNNLTYKNFDIQANFQEETLECNFFAKGRIRLVTVLFILLKVYFNKGVKRLIKRAKRINKAIKA